MIKTKSDLREWLKYEKSLYDITWFDIITLDEMWVSWKYVKYLRYCEYYRNREKKYLLPLFLFNRIRKNLLGMKIGCVIGENCIDKGLLIYHNGSIVINGKAKIGKNLKLHGVNCIGNDGKTTDAPTIGDNVELGVGASITGGVEIANNVIVGANATVVNSCLEERAILVGTPARRVKG